MWSNFKHTVLIAMGLFKPDAEETLQKTLDAAKSMKVQALINGHPGLPQDYELDHLIPLGLGGHPTSVNNLWLQPWTEAAMKDRDELRLHREVCAGRVTLEQAQHEMVAIWGPR